MGMAQAEGGWESRGTPLSTPNWTQIPGTRPHAVLFGTQADEAGLLWNTAGRHGSHSEIPARKTWGRNTWFAKESEPSALLSGYRPVQVTQPGFGPHDGLSTRKAA